MPRTTERVTPKAFILDSLMRRNVTLRPGVAIRAGALLGLSEAAMRVALSRLAAAGMLETTGEGYRLVPDPPDPRFGHVRRWPQVEPVEPWSGHWLAVVLPAGEDRTERRHTKRALELLGFRPSVLGPALRPDNLPWSLDTLRARLTELGAEPTAIVHRVSDLPPKTDRACRRLWKVGELDRRASRLVSEGQQLRARIDRLSADEFLAETYLFGSTASRALVSDPLLPIEINPGTRREELRAIIEVLAKRATAAWARWEAGLDLRPTRARAVGE